jgi:hypothetical protein
MALKKKDGPRCATKGPSHRIWNRNQVGLSPIAIAHLACGCLPLLRRRRRRRPPLAHAASLFQFEKAAPLKCVVACMMKGLVLGGGLLLLALLLAAPADALQGKHLDSAISNVAAPASLNCAFSCTT